MKLDHLMVDTVVVGAGQAGVAMSEQELIDYYVNQECVNVAEECGF